MTAIQMQTDVAEELVVSVVAELQDVAPSGSLDGSAIASTIKTVAALDFGLKVAELPEALLGMFSDAKLNANHIFALDTVIDRIVA